jgi:hypothetical protein
VPDPYIHKMKGFLCPCASSKFVGKISHDIEEAGLKIKIFTMDRAWPTHRCTSCNMVVHIHVKNGSRDSYVFSLVRYHDLGPIGAHDGRYAGEKSYCDSPKTLVGVPSSHTHGVMRYSSPSWFAGREVADWKDCEEVKV